MKNTDERPRRSLDDFHDLSLTPLPVLLLPCNRDTDNISVQRSPCLGSLHEHIILLTFDYDESIALTGHLHLTLVLRKNLLFLLSTTLAAVTLLSCPILILFSRPQRPEDDPIPY